MNIRYKSISELRQLIDDNTLTSDVIIEKTIEMLHADKSNSVLHVCDKVANTMQNTVAASPLAGIPVVYKDNINVVGTPTTCGSKFLHNYQSPYNATIVELMLKHGSIPVGKANMDEFAMGSTNENSAYGAVMNPFNPEHCTGGSSGGSAAVVASGIVPVAFGTDTGGSVRQPAALCGVLGLKPTYGRLSRYGVVSFASSLDQVGIFAREAKDIAITLSAVAGHDAKDSTSVNRSGEDYCAQLTNSIKGKKIGVLKDLIDRVATQEIKARIESSLDVYRQQGCELIDVELPSPEMCVAAYYMLSSSECSSNLSRFDGVRYGERAECDDLESLYVNSRTQGFGREVKRRIMMGTFALSAGFMDAYFIKAQKMRRSILNHFLELFENVDVIALPSSLITAPKLGQEFDYNDDMCTITANLAGLPAISHPVGLADGLPVGLQLIGKHFAEAELLNMCAQFEQHTDYHTLKPSAELLR